MTKHTDGRAYACIVCDAVASVTGRAAPSYTRDRVVFEGQSCYCFKHSQIRDNLNDVAP